MKDIFEKYFTGLEYKDKEGDYNYDLFSESIDSVALLLSENKVNRFSRGDIIKYLSDQNTLFKNYENRLSIDFTEALKTGNYKMYPFSLAYNMELRARYLLQTSKDDSFIKLFEEVIQHLKVYIKENVINDFKEAVQKAESRLFKSKYLFLEPILGHEQNEILKMDSDQDLVSFRSFKYDKDGNIEKSKEELLSELDIKYEERVDNHDLLALKELVLLLRKEKRVDKNSIGIGFFNKYLPEMGEMGYQGVFFKTSDGYIEDIKFAKYSKIRFEERVHYGVFNAADILMRSKVKLKENELVFISVLGEISIPDNYNLYQKSKMVNSKTDLVVETFLYDNIDNSIMGTRIFFTPIIYDKYPIELRTGSVIFGYSDNTFHSVGKEIPQKIEKMLDTFKGLKNKDYRYQEGFVAFDHFFNTENPLFIFEDENREVFINLISSFYEEIDFTKQYFAKEKTSNTNTLWIEETLNIMRNTLPVHKRFNLKLYIEDNHFSNEYHSWWRNIADLYKTSKAFESINRQALRKDIIDLIERESISLEEAKKRVINNDE